jgi:hypothetical protein
MRALMFTGDSCIQTTVVSCCIYVGTEDQEVCMERLTDNNSANVGAKWKARGLQANGQLLVEWSNDAVQQWQPASPSSHAQRSAGILDPTVAAFPPPEACRP